MIYVAVGLEGNMDWPKWADNFVSSYMAWSEIKNKDDIEFRNIGKFIQEKNIPLAEFKEVITMTHAREGLKSTETHLVFGWNGIEDKSQFVSMFGNK